MVCKRAAPVRDSTAFGEIYQLGADPRGPRWPLHDRIPVCGARYSWIDAARGFNATAITCPIAATTPIDSRLLGRLKILYARNGR